MATLQFYKLIRLLNLKIKSFESQLSPETHNRACIVTRPSFLWTKDLIRKKDLVHQEHSEIGHNGGWKHAGTIPLCNCGHWAVTEPPPVQEQ